VRVLYDRRDSALSQMTPDEVEWSLVRQARLLHLTGVTAALGENLRQVLRRGLDEADRAGVPVSFDVNYRSRLWTPVEARQFLVEILPRSILFVGPTMRGRLESRRLPDGVEGASRARAQGDHRADARRGRLCGAD
jgi:2-dehydro-3-deoxygluconokinase